VLEAILDTYVPEAFNDVVSANKDLFLVQTVASTPLREYARTRSTALPNTPITDGAEDAKRQGGKIVSEIVRSPLIFPVLLIFFLWYLARQDTMAERQVLSGLMQAVLQQQTATIGILRDAATRSNSAGEREKPDSKTNSAVPDAPQPKR
jgi:hypothetical protein